MEKKQPSLGPLYALSIFCTLLSSAGLFVCVIAAAAHTNIGNSQLERFEEKNGNQADPTWDQMADLLKDSLAMYSDQFLALFCIQLLQLLVILALLILLWLMTQSTADGDRPPSTLEKELEREAGRPWPPRDPWFG